LTLKCSSYNSFESTVNLSKPQRLLTSQQDAKAHHRTINHSIPSIRFSVMATCWPSRNSRLFPLRPLYALPDFIPFTAVLSAGGFRTRHTSRPISTLSYNHRNVTKRFRIIHSGSIFLGLIMHRYDTLQCLAPLRILAEHSALMHAWPMGSKRTVHIR
jgi:hypothetical protein